MAEIFINQADIDSSETFLTAYLSEKVPEANFEAGSALRDLSVKAFAHVYAYLRGEADRISIYQSLARITEEIAAEEDTAESLDVTQAVDEILSNWFLFREQGVRTRINAQLHFTRKVSLVLQRDVKFWRTNSLAFYLDSESDPYVISANEMLPVFDSRGRLVDYVVSVPLIAALDGEGYNQPAGRFTRLESPGGVPYFSYAEHREDAFGGGGVESSTDFMTRAETAVSVRNLINNRSCDVTLISLFPEISDTMTIGMAENEMIRDKRTELATHIQLHVGGHYDTYIGSALERAEENGTVGGYFPRPDGLVSVFRDPALTYDGPATFTALGVEAGHVLYIRSGIAGVPQGFVITQVTDHEIFVSQNTTFPQASDELDTNAVEYSIGWFSPNFNQLDFGASTYVRTAAQSVALATAHIPPGTSRHVSSPGTIILSGKPVQDIISVEVTDPDSGDVNIIDPSTGTIRFTNRVNLLPNEAFVVGNSEYQVVVPNYAEAQSQHAVVQVNIGYLDDATHFDGRNVKVVYRTLRRFTNIHDYITNRDVKVTAANHLAKARHPIWLRMTIPYRHKTNAEGTVNEEQAAQDIAKYINEFDPNEDLDMSDIATHLRNTYDEIGAVFPFSLYYDLHAPDGQMVQFTTADIVSIFPSDSNDASLLTPSTIPEGLDLIVPDEMQDVGVTSIRTNTELQSYFLTLGVSDRTVVYRASASRITFVLQG